uniref:asparaginase n=1 Tax=Romanomermis culicivorax TaxID=13658 RepID=A0A915K1P0_ROMCU
MTPEAALTKLAYVLGKSEWDLYTKKKMMGKNLRGELTVTKSSDASKSDTDMVRKLSKFLHAVEGEEYDVLKHNLLPSLYCSAACNGDLKLFKQLEARGGNFMKSTYEWKSVLHAAVASGQVEIVRMLLSQKVHVNVKDKHECTPLFYATKKCNEEVIKLLRDAGGRLDMDQLSLGIELCSSVHMRNLAQLKAWKLAGADLNAYDYDSRTALHVACSQGCREIAKFLIESGASINVRDVFGLTPLENAKMNNHEEVVEIFGFENSR